MASHPTSRLVLLLLILLASSRAQQLQVVLGAAPDPSQGTINWQDQNSAEELSATQLRALGLRESGTSLPWLADSWHFFVIHLNHPTNPYMLVENAEFSEVEEFLTAEALAMVASASGLQGNPVLGVRPAYLAAILNAIAEEDLNVQQWAEETQPDPRVGNVAHWAARASHWSPSSLMYEMWTETYAETLSTGVSSAIPDPHLLSVNRLIQCAVRLQYPNQDAARQYLRSSEFEADIASGTLQLTIQAVAIRAIGDPGTTAAPQNGVPLGNGIEGAISDPLTVTVLPGTGSGTTPGSVVHQDTAGVLQTGSAGQPLVFCLGLASIHDGVLLENSDPAGAALSVPLMRLHPHSGIAWCFRPSGTTGVVTGFQWSGGVLPPGLIEVMPPVLGIAP